MRKLELEPKKSIEVINWTHESIERRFLGDIEQNYNEVCSVLDGMPQIMRIYFHNDVVRSEWALNGHAHAADIITISFNANYEDDKQTRKELRELIFHESFHIRQNFTVTARKFSGLESAVYEGCATLFEKEYTNSAPSYGDFESISKEKLEAWLDELKKLDPDMFWKVWQKWLFYDESDGESWKAYLTGSWLVDLALKKSDKSIVDLKDLAANDIVKMYEEFL